MAALLKTPVPAKLLKGVLTGMGQVIFPPPAGAQASAVTRALVEEKIVQKTGQPAEAVAALLDDLARLLAGAARRNLSVAALLEALAQEGVADEATLAVFAAFWKDEGKRIRGVLAARASFNGALAKTAWRVDIVTHASSSAAADADADADAADAEGGEGDGGGGAEEVNRSTAIFELQFERDAERAAAAAQGTPSGTGETVRFEMDKGELEALMGELDAVEAAIGKASLASGEQ